MIAEGDRKIFAVGVDAFVVGVVERITWLSSGEPVVLAVRVEEERGVGEVVVDVGEVVEIPWRSVLLYGEPAS